MLTVRSGSRGVVCPTLVVYDLMEQTSPVFDAVCAALNDYKREGNVTVQVLHGGRLLLILLALQK
jgi:hypothetical protein